MEIFLIRALQLILCFSILIILHEGGHFLFAKLFKVRVEKFCLFFDPWFTPLKFKPKWSDTTYCLGWLPLGGYVKISGMIDESMDKEQMKQPVKPWEFRAKPAWQRLLIMVGGVLVNFVLAFVIYSSVLFTWGEKYVPIENMTHGFQFNEQAHSFGLQDGDILLGTNETTFRDFNSNVLRDISNATTLRVRRDGKEVAISLPGNLSLLEMIKQDPPFAAPLIPAVVDSVIPNGAAAKAGVTKGCVVLAYNGCAIRSVNDYNLNRGRMNDILAAGKHADSLRLRNATLVVQRPAGETDTLKLQLSEDYLMGLAWVNPITDEYKPVTREFTILESIPAGFSYGWSVLTGYVEDLKYIFTSEGAKSVGSFGAIGSMFPTSWDWQRFWNLTAFISLILAFMNILPIPALDGGHVFFLLVEVITRRKPSDAFMEKAQMIGMTLLLLLMAFAIFNDFRNFLW